MTDTAIAHGVAHRPRDVLLTDELGEALRPVLAVERLVRHAGDCMRARGPALPRSPTATLAPRTVLGGEFVVPCTPNPRMGG